MAGRWIWCSLWLWDALVGLAGGHSLFSCEPIVLRMCQDLPYNSTFMPNLLNHYDQQTAALAMEDQRDAGIGQDQREAGIGQDQRDAGIGQDPRDAGIGQDPRDAGIGQDPWDARGAPADQSLFFH
ncbi:hypothetical protein WISP_09612 [Willisornis vidua]|uniref:FZ domain-containing protein n=1 Tax=Willisornis vidua TaxID=1566151 RepID=A0ABQ9DRP3_9PASS|nr:hypothetical protein WISP_09612 [Willisornis vidua]